MKKLRLKFYNAEYVAALASQPLQHHRVWDLEELSPFSTFT